jgi:hypothetical protein
MGGYVPCGLTPVLTGLLVDRTSLAFGVTGFALCITLVAFGVWLSCGARFASYLQYGAL